MTTDTRKRRNYTEDFKRDAVSLVNEQGYKISEAARSLDIGANLLGRWRREFAEEAPLPARVWNRIPDDVRERLITLALDRPELSPRELAVTLTDNEGYFVSESSAYRLLPPPQGQFAV